jgi:hypothetical protein
MAQTNGRMTAAALIAHLLSAYDWQNRKKPAQDDAVFLPGAFLSLQEISTDGKNMLSNTHHPRFPYGAKALHILHKPSVPSASTSFCILQGAVIPRRASVFFSGRRGSLRLL